MLVLSRKLREQIQIGENVTLTILRVKGNTVRIGIDAPRDIKVIRGELPSLQSPREFELQLEGANSGNIDDAPTAARDIPVADEAASPPAGNTKRVTTDSSDDACRVGDVSVFVSDPNQHRVVEVSTESRISITQEPANPLSRDARKPDEAPRRTSESTDHDALGSAADSTEALSTDGQPSEHTNQCASSSHGNTLSATDRGGSSSAGLGHNRLRDIVAAVTQSEKRTQRMS